LTEPGFSDENKVETKNCLIYENADFHHFPTRQSRIAALLPQVVPARQSPQPLASANTSIGGASAGLRLLDRAVLRLRHNRAGEPSQWLSLLGRYNLRQEGRDTETDE